MSEPIIIVGASIAGLATALALGQTGREIIVIDRDPPPPVGGPNEVFTKWQRHGVPQFRHSHGFLARMRNLLRDQYPALHTALLDAGAQERQFQNSLPPVLTRHYTPRPDDEDLTTLMCRRTTFEAVFRQYVQQQPRVTLLCEYKATGVMASPPGPTPLRISGITLDGPTGVESQYGEMIIDACGRRSPFLSWLREHEVQIVEDVHHTQILYHTRFYQLRPGCEEPDRSSYSSLGDLGYLKFGVFPADNQTFSLTLAIPTIEKDLRIVRRNDIFTQVCQSIPALASWIDTDRASPMTDVYTIGGLSNVYRHFVHNGQPAVLGYFAVGEAAIHTNPLYGRGCALSFIHAHLLSQVISQELEPTTRAIQFDTLTRRELRPFYNLAVKRDKAAFKQANNELSPPPSTPWRERFAQSLIKHGLAPALRGEIDVRRAFLRDFNMLEQPGAAIRRPTLLFHILRFWLRGKKRNSSLYAPLPGPSRNEMRRQLGLPLS